MHTEDIISKYLNNSATEEEKSLLLQWLEDKEENRNHFRKTYDLWLYSTAVLADDMEMEMALARLKKQASLFPKKRKRFPVSVVNLLQIAASILLLLSTGYLGYMIGDRDEPTITLNHLLTGADGKGEFLLPDGTTVWLNANSVLKYPETFTGTRTVSLDGEALFEVKKDTKTPFFVEAGGLTIEVTGTRFLANNYSRKSTVEAVLVDGEVRIGGDYFAETRKLNPGELLTYNKQTRQTELRKVNTDDYTNWIHSKLVFDKTNLSQVIINLEKWFGVKIVATPELIRNTHMSFTVRRESLEEVLTYMTLTTPIDYRWEEDILHLFPKNK